MDDTKRLGLVGILALFIIGLAFSVNERVARAEPGWEGATRKEIGSYGQMFKYSGSSIAGTAFFSDSKLRPDGFCYNNNATDVWVGTVSATQRGSASFLHDNINVGVPWKSSTTFALDGSFTGSWYFTCAPGTASCELRCLEGKANQ